MTAAESHLNTDVLVLNRSWYPINLVPAAKAVCMLFEGSASAIDVDLTPHTYPSWLDVSSVYSEDEEAAFIQTTKQKILVPEVIVLKEYDKVPRTKARMSRLNIYRRDGFRCQYCGKIFTRAKLTIDHIVPRSKGGKTSWTNCVAACIDCNRKKANKNLADTGMHLLRQPFEPDGRHMASILMAQRGQSKKGIWEKFIS